MMGGSARNHITPSSTILQRETDMRSPLPLAAATPLSWPCSTLMCTKVEERRLRQWAYLDSAADLSLVTEDFVRRHKLKTRAHHAIDIATVGEQIVTDKVARSVCQHPVDIRSANWWPP